MSRKCACCDTNNELTYVSSADDYYCMTCYYVTYHYTDFDIGYQSARHDIDNGDIDAELGVMSFQIDPPDSASQYGYRQACLHEAQGDECDT